MIQNQGLAQLYRNAYQKWGLKAQMLMVIEEMSELTKCICKSERKGLLAIQDEFMEEYVDVCIMLEQLEVMLSDHLHSFESMYSNLRQSKMKRLRAMLDNK